MKAVAQSHEVAAQRRDRRKAQPHPSGGVRSSFGAHGRHQIRCRPASSYRSGRDALDNQVRSRRGSTIWEPTLASGFFSSSGVFLRDLRGNLPYVSPPPYCG